MAEQPNKDAIQESRQAKLHSAADTLLELVDEQGVAQLLEQKRQIRAKEQERILRPSLPSDPAEWMAAIKSHALRPLDSSDAIAPDVAVQAVRQSLDSTPDEFSFACVRMLLAIWRQIPHLGELK